MDYVILTCISQLYHFARNILKNRHIRSRARFLAESLSAALNDKNYKLCNYLLQDEFLLYKTQLSPPPLPSTDGIAQVVAATPEAGFNELLKIVSIALIRLKPYFSPHYACERGTAIIHRTWLGKALEFTKFNSMLAGNIAVSRKWIDCNTHQKVKPEQILWTNNKAMLSWSGSYTKNCQIRDIDTLFQTKRREVSKIVYSLIKWQEYSFASDVLRYLIMEQYGGLYLGMPWCEAITPASDYFAPVTTSLLVYCNPFGCPWCKLPEPFEFDNTQMFEAYIGHVTKKHKIFLRDTIDSDIIYVGHPHSLFGRRVVDILYNLLTKAMKCTVLGGVKKYRLLMHGGILRDYLKGHVDDLSETAHKRLFQDRYANMAILTNSFPLYMTLVDIGYLIKAVYIQNRNMVMVYRLLDRAKVITKVRKPYGIYANQLGIRRPVSRLWLKIKLHDTVHPDV